MLLHLPLQAAATSTPQQENADVPNVFDSRIDLLNVSVFRFSNTDLARSKIHFVELGFVEVPDRMQFRAPMGTGGEVRSVLGKNIQQQLVVLEFKSHHVRIVCPERVAILLLRIFFQITPLPVAIEIFHHLRPDLLFAYNFVVRDLIDNQIFVAPFSVMPHSHPIVAVPFCVRCAAAPLPRNTVRPFRFPSTPRTV